MTSRKIFDTVQSPSIDFLSPIHNTNTFSLNNKLNQVVNNDEKFFRDKSQGKYKDQQRQRDNQRGTEEKNSFLLKSYDKYDNFDEESNLMRDKRSTVKQSYSRQKSDHKSRSNSPIFNSNSNFNNPPNTGSQILNKNSPQPSVPSQYELLLQYELKRQKEKNEILQKRLSNKEDFIKQMKNIQQDLTIAYARCQQELNQANTLIYQLKNNSTKQIRDYKEQIEELRHQIAVLQNDLKSKDNQPSRKHSNDNHSINNQSSLYYNDSFKKQIEVQRKYIKSKSTLNLTRHKSTGQVQTIKIPSFNKKLSIESPHFVDLKQLKINDQKSKAIQRKQSREKDMVRSNTYSVLITESNRNSNKNMTSKLQTTPLNSQYSSFSPNLQLENNRHSNLLTMIQSQFDISQFQIEIISNISKVSNFLQHFIDMCQKMIDIQQQQNKSPNNYEGNLSKQHGKRQKSSTKQNEKTKLIHELKKYWKWIKQVIKEWKEMKDQRKIIKSKSKRSTINNNRNYQNNQPKYFQSPNFDNNLQYIENQEHQQTFQQV